MPTVHDYTTTPYNLESQFASLASFSVCSPVCYYIFSIYVTTFCLHGGQNHRLQAKTNIYIRLQFSSDDTVLACLDKSKLMAILEAEPQNVNSNQQG